MNFIYYGIIFVFTILLSSFIGYLIPMMYREQKFREYWKKCPECGKTKPQKSVFNIFNFWKYGGYCPKHKTPVKNNVLFTTLFTVFALLPFVFEFIFNGDIININTIAMYIVSTMLVYATVTDFKGMVLPDMCHIVIFLTGLFLTIYTAITTNNPWIYLHHGIGMLCIALPMFLFCLLGKSGFGDVKLFAAIGILLGWQKLLFVLIVAVILGLIYAGFKKITSNDVKWKSEVPFGPFICIGAYIAMIFGDIILRFYLQLY